MKLRITTCAVFLLFASMAAFGQEQEMTWPHKVSFETGCGSYRVPGFILGLDRSITQHPTSLNGFNCNVRLGFDLSRRWVLGVQAFNATAAGNGSWARTDGDAQLAADGVSGSTAGRTNWKLVGATFNFGQTFILRGRAHPFWRAEFGVGKLDVNFRGEFNGCSTEDVGCSFPIVEPAEDRVTRIIPIFGGEGGIQIDVSRSFQLRMGSYWNTGFGGSFSARYRF
jgi:hypothetical protein